MSSVFLRHFSILITVILNSLTVLSSVSYMSLVIILFCLLRLLYFSRILHTLGFFCWKLNILYWVLGTELKSLLAWGFFSVWLGDGLSLIFTVLYVPKASVPLVSFLSPLLSSPSPPLQRGFAFCSPFMRNLLLSYWSPVYVVVLCGRRDALYNLVKLQSFSGLSSLRCYLHMCFSTVLAFLFSLD